jgi:chromosome segregation ATPase
MKRKATLEDLKKQLAVAEKQLADLNVKGQQHNQTVAAVQQNMLICKSAIDALEGTLTIEDGEKEKAATLAKKRGRPALSAAPEPPTVH